MLGLSLFPPTGMTAYWFMVATGVCCVALGTVSQKLQVAAWTFVGAYAGWGIATLYLVIKFARGMTPRTLAGSCLLHLACVLLFMAFMARIMGVGSDDLHIFLPVCVNVGIATAIGVQNLWADLREILSTWPTRIRQWLLRFIDGDYQRLRNQDLEALLSESIPGA